MNTYAKKLLKQTAKEFDYEAFGKTLVLSDLVLQGKCLDLPKPDKNGVVKWK